MRPQTLIFCLVMLFGLSAGAQTTTVPVRGGEHEEFTRLVIPIPAENTWRVTTDRLQARLVVGGPPVVFDLTQTFARIPRTRLQSVTLDDEGLLLQLGCACEIRAAEDIPEYLVIDIVDTGTVPVADTPAVLRPRQRPVEKPDVVSVAPATSARAGARLAVVLKQGEGSLLATPSLLLTQLFDADTSPQTAEQVPTDSNSDMRTRIERELGQALARSVAEGRLRKSDQPVSPAASRNSSATTAQAPDSLAAHLSVTGARRDWTHEATVHADMSNCHDPTLLDISTWRLDHQDTRLGIPLGRVFNDADVLRESYAVDIAKALLADGFGAEARMVLSLLELEDAQIAILRAMSYLIDLAPLPTEDPFLSQQFCGNGASLWAFLNLTDPRLPEDFQFGDLVQRVTNLPKPLRLHLGPVIIDRLVRLERLEEAEQIRGALDRVAQASTPSIALARTQLDLLAAAPEQVTEIETRLSPDMSDEALVFMLTRRDTEDMVTDPHLLELALSRLLVLRGSPMGQELARLTVRALARNRTFAEAFDIFTRYQHSQSPDTIAALRAYLFDRLTDTSSDSDFVLMVFEQAPWDTDELPWRTRTRLAERLEILGFNHQAKLLKTAQNAEHSARPSPSEAHGMEEEAPSAMASLAVTSTDPELLRARDAVSALRRAAEQRDASDSAAMADVPIPTPDAVSSQLQSEEALPPQGDDQNAEGLLAQGRAMLEESSSLRDRLEALLAETDTSP